MGYLTSANFDIDQKTSGLNGYMSKIDKCDFVKSNLTARMIIRKRQLYLRDYNPIMDSVKLSIAMFSMLKNLLALVVSIDVNGYVSVMFNLDAWDDYRAGKFTGKEAEKKGWQNLINHVPTNSIMISIDKYPKSANSEVEPDEIQNRIKGGDLLLGPKRLKYLSVTINQQ